MKLDSISRLVRRLLSRRDRIEEIAVEIHAKLLEADEPDVIRDPVGYLASIAESYPEACKLPPPPELTEWIEKTLPELPPDQVATMLAHKRDQLPHEQTAKRFGVSVKTLQNDYVKGKAALRMKLAYEKTT